MGNQKTPILDYCLYYLHSVPKTEKQLRVKLMEKWYTLSSIDKVIEKLKKMNLINDRRYAQMYIFSEVVNKWKPLFRVKGKLLEKWINKDLIEDVVQENYDDIMEWIKTFLRKEIERLKNKWLDWFDIITKLYNRWYNISLLKEVVNQNV